MHNVAIATQGQPHAYDIRIKPGLLARWQDVALAATGAKRFIILVDRNLASLYALAGADAWNTIEVEPGEAGKNLGQYAELCEKILALGIDRQCVLVAVGGGVTGDIVGFAAATLLRGLRFVQIPTTLLAQVDSSVGGKTGVNAARGKNLIGAFHQPECVIIDPMVLDILPVREYLAGLAEVAKYGVLGDAAFFSLLVESADLLAKRDHAFLAQVIERCCRMKAAIVAEDEKEKGKRALLNLGHTFGHALEALAGYDGNVVHGEAVSVGIVLATRFANGEGLLSDDDAYAIVSGFNRLGLPTRIADIGQKKVDWANLMKTGELARALLHDKKAGDGKLNLILPKAIGECVTMRGVEAEKVASFMRRSL